MIKINNTEFEEKFTEINIRYRVFEEKNYITLIINTELYPTLYNDNIVSGAIETKLDIENIKSLDELVNKNYKGNIGIIKLSINNNGIWEHHTIEDFDVNIKNRTNRKLQFNLSAENCKVQTAGTLVSLYTTNSSNEKLKENFDLNNFYDKAQIREISNNKIYKYFVKE